MFLFHGNKRMKHHQGGKGDLTHTQVVYCVRHLVWKTLMIKHCKIFGKIILNSVYDKCDECD